MENIIKDNISPAVYCGDEKFYNRVMHLAVEVGSAILSYGGSVSRVEIAIDRICSAYGAEEVNVFAIPSMIIACIKLADGTEYSQMKRIYSTGNNFAALEKYNQLSRDICSIKMPLEQAETRLGELKKSKLKSRRIAVLGSALVAGAFSAFFDGALIDFFPALLIGAFLAYLNELFSVRAFNGYARAFVLSLIGGILAVTVCYLLGLCGIECHASMIMTGNIMIVIPGLLITNAVRDLFIGDLVTGLIQFLNGVLITLAIAAGYAVALMLLREVPYEFAATIRDFGSVEYYIYIIISGIIGAFGISLMFNVSFKRIPLAMVNTVITFIVFLVIEYFTGRDVLLSTLVATLVAALGSEILARVIKCPATIFLVPAIIAFVPGASLYFTMNNIVSGNMAAAATYGTNTLLAFLGIAVGISVITLLFQLIYPIKNKMHIKHRLRFKGK